MKVKSNVKAGLSSKCCCCCSIYYDAAQSGEHSPYPTEEFK